MMLGPDGKKLSKRDGAVSVTDYREQGYAPAAVLNYLVRFGWSSGDQEVFSVGELIEKFDWAQCGKGDGKFDAKKFLAIEHEHLRSTRLMPDGEYVERVVPFLKARGIDDPKLDVLRAALPAIRDRAHTFKEAADLLDFFLRDEPVMDAKAAEKALVPASAKLLRGLAGALLATPSWEEALLDVAMKTWAEKEGVLFKDIAGPARVALTGRSASPSLHQVMAVLGKTASLARLAKAASRAEATA
jgi:glutamyl-tRNA synthetase